MRSGKQGLTFHWADRHEVSLARPGFLILALLIHATAFYLFQISYPKAAPIPPPPGQISLLAPTNEENRSILSWVSAQRPSFAPSLRQPLPAGMLEMEYTPSFSEVQTRPARGNDIALTTKYPGLGELPVIRVHRADETQRREVIIPGQPTRFQFSETIRNRAPDHLTNPEWPANSGDIPKPARFLIGINASGTVQYIFSQEGSGSAAHDSRAEEYLAAVAFKPAATINWGMVAVYWGVDALRSAPTSAGHPKVLEQ